VFVLLGFPDSDYPIAENFEQILNISENSEQILNITENSEQILNRF
jgi:hypothetical protein